MSDLFLTSGYSLTLPSGGPTFGVHRLLKSGKQAFSLPAMALRTS